MADWKGVFHVRYWKRRFSGDWRKTKLSMRSRGFSTRERIESLVLRQSPENLRFQ